jgi:hypothetical protein
VPKMRIIFEVEYTAPHRGGGLRFEVSHLRRDEAAPTPFCDESTNSGLKQRQQVSPALRGWQVSRSPASSTPRGWNGSGKSEVPGFPPIPQSDAEWMGHGGLFPFSRSPASSTPRGWNGSGKSEVPGFPPIPQSDAEWMGHGGLFPFSRSPASSTPRGWNGSGKSEVPGFPPIPQSDAQWMGHGGLFLFSGFADVRGSTYMQLPQTLCGIARLREAVRRFRLLVPHEVD